MLHVGQTINANGVTCKVESLDETTGKIVLFFDPTEIAQDKKRFNALSTKATASNFPKTNKSASASKWVSSILKYNRKDT